MVIGVDGDAEYVLTCVEEITKLPDEPDEKEATPVHSFISNLNGVPATQIHPVREVGEFFEDRGVEYDINESLGGSAKVTIRLTDEEDADLIVTVGRKYSLAGKALFGSVAQTVILGSDRPVMVTGSTKRKRQCTRSRITVTSAGVW